MKIETTTLDSSLSTLNKLKKDIVEDNRRDIAKAKLNYECINCGLHMKVDMQPYVFNAEGINTAKKSFYGGWVCCSDCEIEFDKRMRRDAEK